MSQNPGKIFEEQFQKYAPEYALVYRLRDPAQSFGGGSENTRFSAKNPFDFLVWNSERRILFALELKSVQGKSISFERTKADKGEIHLYQVEGLRLWDRYPGTICGFLIEFRQVQTTIFLSIKNYDKLTEMVAKKSFNITDVEESGLSFFVVPQEKLRTRCKYDIDLFLREQKEEP